MNRFHVGRRCARRLARPLVAVVLGAGSLSFRLGGRGSDGAHHGGGRDRLGRGKQECFDDLGQRRRRRSRRGQVFSLRLDDDLAQQMILGDAELAQLHQFEQRNESDDDLVPTWSPRQTIR